MQRPVKGKIILHERTLWLVIGLEHARFEHEETVSLRNHVGRRLPRVSDAFRWRSKSNTRNVFVPASPTKIRSLTVSVFSSVMIALLCSRGTNGPAENRGGSTWG